MKAICLNHYVINLFYYNLSNSDKQDMDKYYFYNKTWIDEYIRILKPNGILIFMVLVKF